MSSEAEAASAIADEAAAVDVRALEALYQKGLYLQAHRRTLEMPPMGEWRETAARLIGSRLAANLGAVKLARTLQISAFRADRRSAEALYYCGLAILDRRGPLAGWKFFRTHPAPEEAPAKIRSDLLALRSRIAATFRDFETAEALLGEAEKLAPDRPWLQVERASVLELQDRYEEALAAARRSIELHPWFRPGVQTVADLLLLRNRDEEALELLRGAMANIESGWLAIQLAALEIELQHPREALETLIRARSLLPLIEPQLLKIYDGRLSDALYHCGDFSAAAEAAERADSSFYKEIAARLKAQPPDARRVHLPVGFVRQHYLTCAPATLTAIAAFWAEKVDHHELSAAICYDGTPDHVERHWAETHGWHAREFKVDWPTAVALLDRGAPFTLATVETSHAHLQAVIGYDSRRGTLLIRDPYERTHGEALGQPFLEQYASSGPRGMILLPLDRRDLISGIDLPEAELYDCYYRLRRALHENRRELAAAEHAQLEITAPGHRLTAMARREIAWYDANQIEALAATEQLLAMFPDDGNLLLGKASALRGIARHGELLDFLKSIAFREKSEPVFWREYASELRSDARSRPEAMRLILRALHRRPVDAENLHALAGILWDQREFEKAAEYYRLAASLRDTLDYLLRSWFIAARHLRQTERALEFLRHRFRLFGKKSGQPAQTLFWALCAVNQTGQAFEMLEEAVALRPEDPGLLLFAADAFGRHGQQERAHALIASAENRASQVALLRAGASLAAYRCDLVEAREKWRAVVEIEPLAVDATRELARLIAETEGRAAALEFLESRCESFPHHIELHRLWVEWLRDEPGAAAEAALRHMISVQPVDVWAHRELALTLAFERRFDEAEAAANHAIQLDPHDAWSYGVRGRVRLMAGRVADAQLDFRSSIELQVDNDSVIGPLVDSCTNAAAKKEALQFIRAELERQVVFGDSLPAFRDTAYPLLDPEELLRTLREALAARPDLWQAWSVVILQLLDMQRLDEALKLAQEAVGRFPLVPKLWLDLAAVHQARLEREEEIRPLQRALLISPGWSNAARRLADVFARLGRFEEALHTFDRAIAAEPLDAVNHGCLADLLWRLNRREEALHRVEQATRLDPGYDWAWETLRDWSASLEKRDRAQELVRELARTRAGEARSWLRVAEMLQGEEHLDERLEALERALELNPRFTAAHDLRATLLCEARRFEEALAACRPAVFQEDLPVILRGRAAWMEADRGNLPRAMELMREALKEAPDYYWGWQRLADWCTSTGDHHGAIEAAQRMAHLAPQSPAPLGYLGDAELALGHRDAGKKALHRAYQIDPTYRWAGVTLFDLHLADDELDEAEAICRVMEQHGTRAEGLWARTRLLSARGEKAGALAALRELCGAPAGDANLLISPDAAVAGAGWAAEAERLYFQLLDQPETNPQVGALWVRRFGARGSWRNKWPKKIAVLLQQNPELGHRALVAYLYALGETGQSILLSRALGTFRAAIEANIDAWGAVTFALVSHQRHAAAARWMTNWRAVPGIQPWMLFNASAAFRVTNRPGEAKAAMQYALGLRADQATPQLRVWLALAHAMDDGEEAAREQLAQVHENSLEASSPLIHLLTVSILTIRAAPVAERKAVFRQQMGLISDPEMRKWLSDLDEKKAVRAGVRKMARDAGSWFGWLHAWFVSRG